MSQLRRMARTLGSLLDCSMPFPLLITMFKFNATENSENSVLCFSKEARHFRYLNPPSFSSQGTSRQHPFGFVKSWVQRFLSWEAILPFLDNLLVRWEPCPWLPVILSLYFFSLFYLFGILSGKSGISLKIKYHWIGLDCILLQILFPLDSAPRPQ